MASVAIAAGAFFLAAAILMQRRTFFQQLAWLTGGLLLFRNASGRAGLLTEPVTVNGLLQSNGKPMAGVVVSDGYSVLRTDSEGKFSVSLHPQATTVFVSTPRGYAFTHQKGIARHYRLLQDIKPSEPIVFELQPLQQDDSEHQFIIWADPQVKNDDDVEKMMRESVPDVKKTIGAMGAGALIHGITVGDIVWDNLPLFDDYDKAVSKMGIPFFQCLGNHDMDYRKGGDDTSDDSFTQAYGPTYYSFNRGDIHYVVMDNVRYLGKDRDYDGFFQQNQLDWLEKDLALVPKDLPVVLCVHIPVHKGTKNKEALYKLLEGRTVHLMSGHTHYNVNAIKDNVYEHNHGAVCGAWWTGDICEDGTPCGYGVYKVKGKDISWHYQATGKPAGYQMKLYTTPYSDDSIQVVANIWNHDPAWKTEYLVDGESKGTLTQFEGYDMDAFKKMMGPDLPKPRGFAEPQQTKHLFSAVVPATAKKVTVIATDRFGRQYTETIKPNA